MKFRLIVSFIYVMGAFSYGQIVDEKDAAICLAKFKLASGENLKSKSIGDVIAGIGESFIGTDYKAFGLEREGEEKLVVDLMGLDCTTFVENALVFARIIKKDSVTIECYTRELKFIRYRNGIIDRYPSRLHYFSDWIYDNVNKHAVRDISKELGGDPIKFRVNFMSSHPTLYKHLNENPSFIPIIRLQEDSISSRIYHYIPKNKAASIESRLRDGDIIAFTTSVKGLDIGHVGLAVKGKDGRVHLLHAPQKNTKVQLTKEPLSDYILRVKDDTGIVVLRALEP
jgi:hypothetical protein